MFFFFFLFSANLNFFFLLVFYLMFFFSGFITHSCNSVIFLACSFFFNQVYSTLAFIFFFFLLNCFFQKTTCPGWLVSSYAFIPALLFKFFKAPAGLSLTLWNGLVFIHPLLIAISFFFIFFLLRFFYFKFLKYKDFFFFLRRINYFFFLSIVGALILGALWAQQELNWGGWWSWDAVEVGCLYICIFAVQLQHRGLCIKHLAPLFYFCIFFILGIRYNFFNSVHSFVASSFFFNSCLLAFCTFYIFYLASPFFNVWSSSGANFLVLLFFFLGFINISFFFFFIFIVLFFFVLFFSASFPLAPLPIWFVSFNFLKKSAVFHFFFWCTFVSLFFFKGGLVYVKFWAAQLEPVELAVGDFFIFEKVQVVFNYFITNTAALPTLNSGYSSFTNVFVFFLKLAAFFQDVQQQGIYFYRWTFFLQFLTVFFVSFLFSFNIFLFFLKKKV